MAEESRGCLKGCLIGCGVAVLLAIILPIVGGMLMVGPFRHAIDAREEIENRFGDEGSFTPAADGAIDSKRIEAFLSVRQATASVASKLEAASAQMRRMDEFDDDASRRKVLGEAFKTTRAAFGIAPQMGEFFHARNQALLKAEMSLGEYTYIYVMAYHEQLREDQDWGELFDDSPINRRISEVLQSILANQLAALESSGASSDEVALLRQQIAAIEDDYEALPWEAGLPEPIAQSIEPFRQRLDDVFFPATASLDLMKNTSHGGFAIETE